MVYVSSVLSSSFLLGAARRDEGRSGGARNTHFVALSLLLYLTLLTGHRLLFDRGKIATALCIIWRDKPRDPNYLPTMEPIQSLKLPRGIILASSRGTKYLSSEARHIITNQKLPPPPAARGPAQHSDLLHLRCDRHHHLSMHRCPQTNNLIPTDRHSIPSLESLASLQPLSLSLGQ